MSAKKQSSEVAKESSPSLERSCEVENIAENDSALSVLKESICSKCGKTKCINETDLELSREDELICKCDPELEEKHEENKTYLEIHTNISETEKSKSEKQSLAALEESSKEKPAESDSVNFTAAKAVDPKPSTESEQQRSEPNLNELKEDENNSVTTQAGATAEEISQMEEGEDGRQSPGVSSETPLTRLMRNYPSNVRCTEDSGSSESNRRSPNNENLAMVCLACLLMCPVLILLSVLFAYQLWQYGRLTPDSNFMEDLSRNSTADED